jgi:hypothetical protein
MMNKNGSVITNIPQLPRRCTQQEDSTLELKLPTGQTCTVYQINNPSIAPLKWFYKKEMQHVLKQWNKIWGEHEPVHVIEIKFNHEMIYLIVFNCWLKKTLRKLMRKRNPGVQTHIYVTLHDGKRYLSCAITWDALKEALAKNVDPSLATLLAKSAAS